MIRKIFWIVSLCLGICVNTTSTLARDIPKETASQISTPENSKVFGVPDSLVRSYQRSVSTHIRKRIAFNPADVSGNPVVIFLVTQDERGVVLQTDLLQSSGFDKWDEAVEKAIRQSSPLPLASDGSYEKRLELRFVPKDKNYVPRSKVSEVHSGAYNKRISEHIRAHIISDKVPKLRSQGEYVVVFSVRQDSDGNVKQVIKTEESGLLEWDHAVEKAIWKSSPLPLAEDSTYTSHFSIPFVLSRKKR